MDSDFNHPSDCVFYDSELRQLRAAFKSCSDIFKKIDKRASRAQTIQINRSLFDYSERKKDMKVIPQKYYDFRFDNYRICIYFYKGRYSILCVGFDWIHDYLRVCDFSGAGHLYCEGSSLDSMTLAFRRCVEYFLNEFLIRKDWNLPSSDIPF